MRNLLLLACLASCSLAACKWTDFDDLADETWVHSTEKPSVGSSDYATALVGATIGATGGQLAVVGNDSPSYSTLDYNAKGETKVGPNPQRLGVHFISALSDPPIFVTDGMGKIALVERALDGGNIAVFMGPATAPADAPFPSTSTPDAATFAGANLIVAAGANLYTVTGTGAPTMSMADMIGADAFAAAALASDGTTLYAWTKAGVFLSYPLASLTAGGTLPAPTTTVTTTLMPGPGARIHLVGTFAILAGSASSGQGQVAVIDLTSVTAVGAAMAVDGLRSSTVAVIGTSTYLALGAPNRSVGGVAAGQVDLYAVDTTTGTLGAAPVLQLNDAQPESGAKFGRAVTAMKFNDQTILVVGGASEVFAYYKTSLYDALP